MNEHSDIEKTWVDSAEDAEESLVENNETSSDPILNAPEGDSKSVSEENEAKLDALLVDQAIDSEDDSPLSFESGKYPVLPLRDVVLMPGTVMPFFVGRETSIKALEAALDLFHGRIMMTAQVDAELENPDFKDLYPSGCLGKVLQVLNVPGEDTIKVLVEGRERAQMKVCVQKKPYMMVEVTVAESSTKTVDLEDDTLARTLLAQFEQYVGLNKKMPSEIVNAMSNLTDLARLSDGITSHTPLSLEDKQSLLEENDCLVRSENLVGLLESEISMMMVERKIHQRVKQQMDNTQLKYFLTEKLSAVQDELKEIDGNGGSEIAQFEKKMATLGLSDEAQEKAKSELDKLKMMSPMSSEATVVRHYLDWLLGLPWSSRSKINKNLDKAEDILNHDHYGLVKIKERILEYLAVEQRSKQSKGPILCLVGPPGVGKTSLGESIARATSRKFVRLSLGGVRDESEIRGHRKTYIGAMPGKIVQKLVRCEKNNPLFMLDEIDKMGMDFRGDPASALLEVLDPSQNHQFNDHYLEVDFDLSDIMFIATANSLDIPHALMDRMEIIQLSGYTEREKGMIANHYLIAKQLKAAGLKAVDLRFTDGAIAEIIAHYTHEAGVRELDRCIAKIARKVVLKLVKGKLKKRFTIKASSVESYLGIRRYAYDTVDKEDKVGQVTGLAWTELGGDILTLEAAVIPGKSETSYTGSLGDVMQESIQAALTVIKSRMDQFNLAPGDFEDKNIHVHVPEGATPKDGPSAGIGMCVALASAFSRIPVKSGLAMTGEITLRGEVLPIGGLKEKLLAAVRSGVKHAIIPKENVKDLKDLPKEVKQALQITPVKWIDEVFAFSLAQWPLPCHSGVKSEKKTTVNNSKPAIQQGRDAADIVC